MSSVNKFKYDPMTENRAEEILKHHEGQPVIDYIKELWELIHYQKDIIAKQRIEIIGRKHQDSWKHYDK
jgi:hypothetical protein